ncbi:MAG TPA: glycoside hydrolase domain-containing protein [Thermoguttaceae bacterium]|nr:glycoside hydrolase domain-containing protein [Thermoguttaceae bacterium]
MVKSPSLLASCLAAGCLLLPAAVAAEPESLVLNGGFEEGGELPDWWNRHPQENADGNRHLRDQQVFRSGKASALLRSVTPHPKGEAGIQWNRYGIAVEGGSVLAVSFYVKTEGVAAAGAGCHFYDENREHLGFVPVRGPDRADEWTRVARTVYVPPNAKTMGFALYGRDCGKTWYDDVSVVPDLEAAARRAAARARFEIPTEGDGRFRVVPVHSLQKIARDQPVLDAPILDRVELHAARDESEAFQLVVIPGGRALEGVGVEPAPLVGPGGKLDLQWNRVGYVKTAPPSYPVEYVGWWPDPLLPPGPFDLAADGRQPLWFRVDVPPDAAPGRYTGQVTIRHGDQAKSIPVVLHVRRFRLPRPGTLATPFGLYASALARGYDAKAPYHAVMPPEVYRRWCRFLAERRLTPKNVAREYITVKQGDGGWQVDLAGLDETVASLAPDYYAPYSFCLDRLPSANTLWKDAAKPDPAPWVDRTAAIAAEWKRRGLPPEVYLYGPDEPRPTDYPFLRDLYARLRQAVPGFPIMQTIGDPNPQDLVGLVDIWCPLTARAETEFYGDRLEAGDALWTYVCCSPKLPHANFFIDEPASDHRVLFWQARKLGATGVLYWCVCWWPGLPTPAAGERAFPDVPVDLADAETYRSFKCNGDGLLVYPGPDWTPYSSIRLEVIRDGVEDYEYLALLSGLIEKAKALPDDRRPDAALLREAESLSLVPDSISRTMTDYTKDPQSLLNRRQRVAEMIERLAEFGPATLTMGQSSAPADPRPSTTAPPPTR